MRVDGRGEREGQWKAQGWREEGVSIYTGGKEGETGKRDTNSYMYMHILNLHYMYMHMYIYTVIL